MTKNEKKLKKVNRQIRELHLEVNLQAFRILSEPLWIKKRQLLAKLNKWNDLSDREVVLIK